MQTLITFLQGKKSYLVSLLGVCFSLVGYHMGVLTPEQAFQMALTACGIATLRNAIK